MYVLIDIEVALVNNRQNQAVYHDCYSTLISNGYTRVLSLTMAASDLHDIATKWLYGFSQGLASGNPSFVSELFTEDSWLRDVLTFSWDSRSLRGPSAIAAYLKESLKTIDIANVALDMARSGMEPQLSPHIPGGVEFGFVFETVIGFHRGHTRLTRTGDAYKAIVVFTTMDELKGYPESKTFVKADRCQIETDPQVLIVGAGHCGIQIAARFKQMGISALVVDRNRRVGDAWRNRYPSLHLHTIKDFSQSERSELSVDASTILIDFVALYQPFPSDWPEFIPKDKLADWFEQYVINQDLVVWNSSTLVPKPAYNQATRRWTVNIKRADRSSVTLHPLHIIMAIGFMNKPRIPDVPGKSDFKGKIMHTSDFSSTYPVSDFRNKHLVIVGAGNSSGDISQFLVSSPNSSPASITIVQRSSTCVASLSTFTGQMKPIWPPSSVTPIEVADFRANAMPTALVRKININMAPIFKGMDKDMFDGLTEAGMRLNYGSDDSGPGILVRETASGLCEAQHPSNITMTSC